MDAYRINLEAIQYTGTNVDELEPFIGVVSKHHITNGKVIKSAPKLSSHSYAINLGDWVIRINANMCLAVSPSIYELFENINGKEDDEA